MGWGVAVFLVIVLATAFVLGVSTRARRPRGEPKKPEWLSVIDRRLREEEWTLGLLELAGGRVRELRDEGYARRGVEVQRTPSEKGRPEELRVMSTVEYTLREEHLLVGFFLEVARSGMDVTERYYGSLSATVRVESGQSISLL